MSRDDLKFMNIVEDSVVQCADGHYQVSLPLRNHNVKMPVNRSQAERSASYLKRKLSNDTKLREHYVALLEEVISAGYAEKVPQNVLDRSDGLSPTMVCTIIRRRIKYVWFSTVPPSFMGRLETTSYYKDQT